MYPIYSAWVLDATTLLPNADLKGQQVQVVTRGTTTPYPIFNGAGDPITSSLVTVTEAASTPTVYIDTETPEVVYLDWYDAGSGQRGPIWFEEVSRQSAVGAHAAAEALAEAAAGAVRFVNGQAPDSFGNVAVATGSGGDLTWSTLSGKPTTFPPSGHTHLLTEISNASTIGRTLAAAATAQDARAAIGAGTGNGTSNLVLGTTGTTAAAGNHTHAQYVDSAQAATIADQRIAANGGGGGGGPFLPWRYASGAYPALPATIPAGVVRVFAEGPVAPSTLPSWIGNAAGQATLNYDYNPELT